MIFDIVKLGVGLLDKIIPDPVEREKAKVALIQAQANNELRAVEQQLSAIIAEAQSSDPWTSRARPGFLWTMYILILSAIPMGVIHAYSPETASAISTGFKDWLTAIPDNFVTLFGIGYLGYTGARGYQEVKRLQHGK